MKTNAFALILIILFFSCKPEKKTETQLITLSNGTIEIGILPEVGGRLVHVSMVGQANILMADSAQWNESEEQRPSLDPKVPFQAYNGHITWLNPQSEWWSKQDSIPELRDAQALWPPDPYLILAPYSIVGQKSNEIALISPESPFTKVQFTKIYTIEGNTITLTTMARNISTDTVSWGLWHNTRMNGWDAVFVQADSLALQKTSYMEQGDNQIPQLHYTNGFYSYEADQPVGTQPVYKSKSFFNVETPLIAGFHQNQWLIIRSDAIDPNKIHLEEARVELYLENSDTPSKDLQELEIQFPYQKIAPQAFIEATETWEIMPGSGLTDKTELLEELKGLLKIFN